MLRQKNHLKIFAMLPVGGQKNTEGSSNKLNDVFTVHFGDTFVTFKITEFNPLQKIVWSVTDSVLPWLNDKKEWNNTKIIFDISGNETLSTIKMTHDGLVPAVECYDNCEKGWNFYTGKSLLNLINEGKGLPDTPHVERIN